MITVTTFTNKAANEIRSRIVAQVGPEASLMQAATFHSLCYRMVRRQGWALGPLHSPLCRPGGRETAQDRAGCGGFVAVDFSMTGHLRHLGALRLSQL